MIKISRAFPVKENFPKPTSMLAKLANSFAKIPFDSKFCNTVRISGTFN